MKLYSLSLLVMMCFCIIYTGYVLGYGIDEQYQLDQKYLKVCHDFIGSQKTAIEKPDKFCVTYSEMMRTTK